MKTNERVERKCPICGAVYYDVPAISRTDNKTPICPDCGIRESLESIGVNEKEQEKILGIIHSCKANID